MVKQSSGKPRDLTRKAPEGAEDGVGCPDVHGLFPAKAEVRDD